MDERLLSPKAEERIAKLRQLHPDAPPYVDFIEKTAKAIISGARKCAIDIVLDEYSEFATWGTELVKYDSKKQNEALSRGQRYNPVTADTIFLLKKELGEGVQDTLNSSCKCDLRRGK